MADEQTDDTSIPIVTDVFYRSFFWRGNRAIPVKQILQTSFYRFQRRRIGGFNASKPRLCASKPRC